MTDNRILDIVNQRADELHVPRQQFQRLFYLEQLLIQLSSSEYRNVFIFKGGLEIQEMLGIRYRTTVDADATLTGYDVTEDVLRKLLEKIFADQVADGSLVTFHVSEIRQEMANNQYPGFRVSLSVRFGNTRDRIKIDISTGDEIYPAPVTFTHHSLLDQSKTVQFRAFPQEQIIADKAVTLLQREEANTRAKDSYDLYALTTMEQKDWDWPSLRTAFAKTARKKGLPLPTLTELSDVLVRLKNSNALQSNWVRYQKEHEFARGIDYETVMGTIGDLLQRLINIGN
ncbi:nucleotidyl transferase AbiEii/AbiGii toxin family protein [Schleiferilactobacillus harbinensis]|uniref:Nucleotidyl transferase AbiEii/AbiGii toxin family protein n=1 Tax=Schleiferilactobacillus harbinensis TaxID=304207 RepID=A0A5P8M995_9LACO|nr:nucleotidyl transferase AbiEii/AbiGii toxin family protein [Schleiferilactobacillus harbinensis]QFR24581.1 nucleotidyl transferase AbiEii/AbiGii toxin family protein [Schleiferilactobacillus harbinensis]